MLAGNCGNGKGNEGEIPVDLQVILSLAREGALPLSVSKDFCIPA